MNVQDVRKRLGWNSGLSSYRLCFGLRLVPAFYLYIVEINQLDIVANGLFLTGNLYVKVPANFTSPVIKTRVSSFRF